MSRTDDLITRRKARKSSILSSASADQLPAGPIWAASNAESSMIELKTFRPPPIQRKKEDVGPMRAHPDVASEGNVRLDPPKLHQPRIRTSEQFQEYLNWLQQHQDVQVENELTENARELLLEQGIQTVDASQGDTSPSVVFVDSQVRPGYRRTFVDVDLAQLTEPPKPKAQFRVDSEHDFHQEMSQPHLRYEEVVEETTPVPASAQPVQIGDPELPYSSIVVDDQAAEVVATISAAIASVIQERSEEEVRQEADAYLRKTARPIPTTMPVSASHQADVMEGAQVDSQERIDEISDDMLNDIIRQRMAQLEESSDVNDLLQERIERHDAALEPSDTIPFAQEVDAKVAMVAQPVAEFAAWDAAGQDATPMVVMSDAQEQTQSELADENDVPVSLAAWDVEDFRWPLVTNQMIVKGGHAIGGLLQALVEQLPDVPRRVAISGVGRIQGTTSIAIGIARWSAAAGYRTLLIDADVASPSLSQRLGMTSEISWLNGINDELPPAELIIRSKKSNLCVMPLAASVTRVTWPRFIFDNLGEVLGSVKNSFDLILIDSGPASQLLDELSTPNKLLDSVVVVNESGDPAGLETTMTRLSTFGIDRFVMAENRVGEAKPNVA